MLALCSMLWHAYYAKNYTGIIGASLPPLHASKLLSLYSKQFLKQLQCHNCSPFSQISNVSSLFAYLIHPPGKGDVLSFSQVAPLYTCHLESFAFVAIQLYNHFARF